MRIDASPGSFNRASGVTLIELMVVMALLAIISTIAVSSYRSQALRARRSEATSMLLRIQVAQEKFFLQNNTYTDNFTGAPPAGLGVGGDTTPGGHYEISLDAGPDGIGTSYVATATASATAGQTADKAECHVLTINQSGSRSPPESSGCWR